MQEFLELGIIFTISSLLSLVLIKAFSFFFKKWNILDNPGKYNLKRKAIPYSMGVIFFLNYAILSSFFVEHNDKYFKILILGFIVTLISFIDDLFDISPKFRLFVQIGIGAIIGLTAIKIGYISNIFGGVIDLENSFFSLSLLGIDFNIISLLFTIFWYVLIFNSLNWSDGVPGLTSGLTLASFCVIFLLGAKLFLTDNYSGGVENAEFIMNNAIILIGSLIIFWFFDFKEKILMGDSGTMFLAFMLATLAIISGGKIATVTAVFGIYIADAFYVILKRLFSGKSPLKKDFSHLHHRLLDLGFSKREVCLFVYSFSAIFGIISLFLDKIGKMILFILIVLFVFFINTIFSKIKGLKKLRD